MNVDQRGTKRHTLRVLRLVSTLLSVLFALGCTAEVSTLDVEFTRRVVTTESGDEVDGWPLGFGCRMKRDEFQGAWVQPPEMPCAGGTGDSPNERALELGYLVFMEALRLARDTGTSSGLCVVTDVISWSGPSYDDVSELLSACERRLIDCELRARRQVQIDIPESLVSYLDYLMCAEGADEPRDLSALRDGLADFLESYRSALLAAPDVVGGVVAQSVPDLSMVRVFGTTKSCGQVLEGAIINPVGTLVGDFRTIVGAVASKPVPLSSLGSSTLPLDHIAGGDAPWCDVCGVCRSLMSAPFCRGLTVDDSSLPPGAVGARFTACPEE